MFRIPTLSYLQRYNNIRDNTGFRIPPHIDSAVYTSLQLYQCACADSWPRVIGPGTGPITFWPLVFMRKLRLRPCKWWCARTTQRAGGSDIIKICMGAILIHQFTVVSVRMRRQLTSGHWPRNGANNLWPLVFMRKLRLRPCKWWCARTTQRVGQWYHQSAILIYA